MPTPISEPIGYVVLPNGQRLEVHPTPNFYLRLQPPLLTVAALDLVEASNLAYNGSASDATNFSRLHTKIGALVAALRTWAAELKNGDVVTYKE